MNPQFKRKLIGVAVASCFAGTAYGNPVGPAVVSGTVGVGAAGKTLTVTNSPGAIINWQSFSIAADEATRFIQQSAASSVLNRVVGVDPSLIFGLLQSNGRVFLINPSGILFGATARIDVPGFVASTLDMSNADFLNGRFNFAETPGAAGIDNQGTINTPSGGFVYLVATDVKNSGIITSPQGEVILAAGKSVELVNPGSPDIRVVLTAPDNQAVNVGTLIAKSGRIGIYGGLISQQGVVNANTVVKGKNGEIIFKATKDITLDPGSVTTASGEENGVKDGGEIRLVADGTLTVAQDAQVRVDGGPNGGDGGFLELSGKQLVLNGIMSGRAQPGYQGGTVHYDPLFVYITTGSACGSGITCITPANLDGSGSGFSNVVVDADNTLRVLSAIGTGDINGGAAGGSLTLNAGNLLLVNAPIGASGSGTRFDHDLNLRSQNDVVIQNSIFMGNRTLKLEADVQIPSLNGGAGLPGYGDNIGSVLITAYDGPVTVSTLGDINVNAPYMGVMGGLGAGQSVKVSAGNDININLSGYRELNVSPCAIDECGALGVFGGSGAGAFAEVTAGNDLKILATDPTYANAAVWGGSGPGAYAKLRAGNDLVLDLRPAPGVPDLYGGGWLDVFASGGGTNAYAEASAGRDIKSWDLVTNGSGGLDIGSGATTIGGVIVEGGSRSDSPFALISSVESNQTATLSAGYTDAGVPTSGSINLDLAYGMKVLGGDVSANVDGGEGGTLKTDASAWVRAAGDVNISVAGTGLSPSSAAVRIEGGSAFAEGSNAYGFGVTTTADMKADATVTAYGGEVSITVANGSIKVAGGSAEASASLFNSGGLFIGGGTNKAIAQAKTTISAKTGVTLDAQNGSINIHGGQAVANAGHAASSASSVSLSGNNTATATAGVAITAGATSTVSIHGYGGVEIDAGYGGAFAFHHQSSASNVNMSGDNSASAYGGLAVSGGSISITADSGEINVYAPAALAVATHWLETGSGSGSVSVSGASINGNNQAYAEFNLVLDASGADSIVIDAGANSVQLGGGSPLWVDELEIWLPRGAMARAEHKVFGESSNNSLTGNNQATTKAAMSFTSAGPVNISGGSVTILAGGDLAVASKEVFGSSLERRARDVTLSGSNTASAYGGMTITAGSTSAVSVTGANGVFLDPGYGAAIATNNFENTSGSSGSGGVVSTASGNNTAATYGGTVIAGGSVSLTAPYGGVTIWAPAAAAVAGSHTSHTSFVSTNPDTAGANQAYADVPLTITASYGGGAGITIAAGNGGVQLGGGSSLFVPEIEISVSRGARAMAEKFASGGFGVFNDLNADNRATANSGVTLEGVGSAGVSITAADGGISISGGDVSASAAKYVSYSFGSSNALSGNNTAEASGKLMVKSGSGNVDIKTTAGSGSVNIQTNNTHADAYNSFYGDGGSAGTTLSGDHKATAYGGIDLTAGGALSITSYGGYVQIYGPWRSAFAYNSGSSASNFDVSGSNTATVNSELTVTGASVAVTAGGSGNLNINGGGAQANAYSQLVSNDTSDNTVDTTNTATINGGTAINATGGNLLLSAASGGVNVDGGEGFAQAYKVIDPGLFNFFSGNELLGVNTAGVGNKMTLAATGDVDIKTTAGTNSVNLNAGGGEGRAYNSLWAFGATVEDNTLSGNNSATYTGGMDVTAGAADAVTIASYGGSVSISGPWVTAETGNHAEGFGFLTLSGNSIAGNNAATATAALNVTGGAVMVTANNYLTVSGGNATANAHSVIDSSGAFANKINDAAPTNANTATATGGVTLNATNATGAYGGLTLSAASGGSGSLNVNGGSANADAHKDFDNSSGSGNVIRGGNTATATNKTLLKSNSGDVDIETTAGTGQVYISNNSVNADAYNQFSGDGYGGAISGAHSATANGGMEITAGATSGAVTIASYGGYVQIYGPSRDADAYNQNGSPAFDFSVSGANSATVNAALTVTGASITVAAGGSGSLIVGGRDAEADAHTALFCCSNASSNTINTTNTATVNGGATFNATGTGGALQFTAAGGSVNIDGGEGQARAYKYVYPFTSNDFNTLQGAQTAIVNNRMLIKSNSGDVDIKTTAGSNSVNVTADGGEGRAYASFSGYGGTISGDHSATYTGGMDVSAGGNLNLVGYGGSVAVFASTAGGQAYKSGSSATAYNVSGAYTASANNDLKLSAGTDISIVTITGLGDISVSNSDSHSNDAYTRVGGSDNTVSGNNGVTASMVVTASAGRDVLLTSYGGSVGVKDTHTNDFASAYQYVSSGDNNQISGNNTSTIDNSVKISAGRDIVVSAVSSFIVSGSTAEADAWKQVNSGTGNTLSGTNSATATNGASLTATRDIVITAPSVTMDGSCCDSASAFQYVSGNGNNVSGNSTATTSNLFALKAGGDLTVNGSLSLDGGSEAEGSAYQSVGGDSNTLSGQNTASLTNKVSVTASGTLTVTGSLNMNAGSPSSNSAYQSVSGTGNNVNGTNASTMNLNVALSAGAMNLSTVNLSGTSAGSNSAYQSVSGSGNTVGGSNTVNTATTLTLTATGAMTIAGDGLSVQPSFASAVAYRSAGSGNTLSGTNSATAESSMKVSAGSLTVTSGDVTVNGGGSSFSPVSAYTSGTGDNQATAKSLATLTAGSLTVAGGSLSVNGGNAFASHGGTGAGAPVADASATVNSGVVNVSGDVFLSGGSAYTFTSGTGAPQASANASILMGSGAKTMTIGGSLGLFGGITGVTGAAGTPSAYALIDPGQLTITTITGDIDLIGGDGVNTSAGLHAFGPVVLNIGGSSLNLIGGPGSGLFAGAGSDITVSFPNSTIESPGTITVDNTCLTCGDAFVLTEPTLFEFAPPSELFIPEEAPTPPDEEEEEDEPTVSGTDEGGTEGEAPEDEGKPTCT